MSIGRFVAAFALIAAIMGILGSAQPFGADTSKAAPVVTDLGAVIGGNAQGTAALSLVVNQPAIGDVVAVAISLPDVAGDITVTDDAGNVYTLDAGVSNGGTVRTAVFSAVITNALTSSDEILVDTPATSGVVLVSAIAMSGVVKPAVNSSSSATDGGANHAAVSMDPGDVTTTVNDAVLFASYGIAGASANPLFTAPPSFAEHQSFGSGSDRAATAYRSVAASNTFSAVGGYDSDDTLGNLFSAQVVVAYQSAIPPEVTDLGSSQGGDAQGETGKTLDAGADVGDVVIVALSFPDDATGDVSASDEKGNTYTVDADVSNPGLVRTVVLSTTVATALVAGDDVFVQTPHTGGRIQVAVLAVKGITRPPVDTSTDIADGGANHAFMSMNPGSVTTTEAGGLLFAAFGITGSSQNPAYSAPANFIEHIDLPVGEDVLGTAYDFPGTAATYSGVATFDSDDDPGTHNSAQAIVAYAPVTDTDPPLSKLVVDLTAPIDFAGPPEGPDGDNGWFVSFTNIQIQVSDASDIEETRCVVNTDGAGTVPATFDDIPAGCGFAAPNSAGFSGGVRDVYFASRDIHGNTEDVQHVELKIDTTDPSTTITRDPASPNGNNGWYVTSVDVTVAGTDDSAPSSESGVGEVRCVTNPVTPPLTFDDIPSGCVFGGSGSALTNDGEYTVYAATKDNAGNTSLIVDSGIDIDRSVPNVTIVLDPGSPDGDNGFYVSPVGVTVGANDSVSGVAELRCAISTPSNPVSAPASFDAMAAGCALTTEQLFSEDGSYTVYAAAKDNAGNEGDVASDTFKIDQTAPEFSFYYDYGTGEFEVEGGDANGIASVVETGSGSTRVFTVTDNAGNETVLRAQIVNVGFFAFFRLLDVQYGDEEPVDLFAWGIVIALSDFPWSASYDMVHQILFVGEPTGLKTVFATWFSQGGPGTTTINAIGGGVLPGQVTIWIGSYEGDIELNW